MTHHDFATTITVDLAGRLAIWFKVPVPVVRSRPLGKRLALSLRTVRDSTLRREGADASILRGDP